MDKLNEFTEFLKFVELNKYRKQYAHIKIVEMDLLLPKQLCLKFKVNRMDIQAINLLYKTYWEDKNFISFDEFIEVLTQKKVDDIHLTVKTLEAKLDPNKMGQLKSFLLT